MQRRTLTAALCGAAVLAFGLTGCGDKTPEAPKAVTLTVGATPVPHADILKFIEPALKKEGVNLKVVEFSDYVKPNLALSDKELDANFFQHKPYLDTFSAERGLKLSVLCSVHIEPMGVYSRKVKSPKVPRLRSRMIPRTAAVRSKFLLTPGFSGSRMAWA